MTTQKENITGTGKKVPTAGGLPVIGLSLKAARDPLALLKALTQQYGDVVKVRLGLKDFYLVQSPSAARHVLQEKARNYYKPGAAKLMKKVLGDGLATSNGDLWLQQRRVIQPAFHHQKLAGFFDILQDEITTLVNEWKNNDGHQPVDISKAIMHLALNNLTRAMFGAGIDRDIETIARVLGVMLDCSADHAKSLVKIPLSFPTKNNRRFRKAEEEFERIIYRFISGRQSEQEQALETAHHDLLQMLLSARDASGESMSAKQLRDEIATTFLAGHETTSQTLGWIFYHLAMDRQLYQKVKAEAELLSNCKITMESLRQLPFTKSVIEEAMRFYPPIWVIARKAAGNDCINGYRIPAGATLLVNVYGMHHHPGYWTSPQTFDPSHFSNDVPATRPPFLYLPFGGGPRLCIGQHFALMVIQTVVMRLVLEFEFSLPPNFAPTIDANVTLRAKDGIRLFIQQTNNHAISHSSERLC